MDPIRVPRIRENYHRVPKIRENRVPTDPNIFLKKNWFYTEQTFLAVSMITLVDF